MLRAIELGKNALGSAAPNPMVGCCIVHRDRIIGEGYTSAHGGPHAEVNAIRSVTDTSILKEATLYVTLEPCSHFGKTPPCSDIIIDKGVGKVVIGLQDPNPKVAGRGIEKLRKAGVEVVVGVMENACRWHHRRFLTAFEKRRPYIILKWAESQDGFLVPDRNLKDTERRPIWITNSLSRQWVHQWRHEEQAILVGTQTLIDADPKLDVRNVAGQSPVRIGLDRQLRVPTASHIFDDSVRTLIFTEKQTDRSTDRTQFKKMAFDSEFIPNLCTELWKLELHSLIVEGGASTLQSFLSLGLWDEARIFRGPVLFHSGKPSPKIIGSVHVETDLKQDRLTVLTNDQEHHL